LTIKAFLKSEEKKRNKEAADSQTAAASVPPVVTESLGTPAPSATADQASAGSNNEAPSAIGDGVAAEDHNATEAGKHEVVDSIEDVPEVRMPYHNLWALLTLLRLLTRIVTWNGRRSTRMSRKALKA